MNLCEYLLDGSFIKLETRDYPSLVKIIFAPTSSLKLLLNAFPVETNAPRYVPNLKIESKYQVSRNYLFKYFER